MSQVEYHNGKNFMKKHLIHALTLTFLLSLVACSSGPETSESGEDAPPATEGATTEASTDQAPAPEPTQVADQSEAAPAAAGDPAPPSGLEDDSARKLDEAALAQVTVPSPEETAAPNADQPAADQQTSADAPVPAQASADAPPPAPATSSSKHAAASHQSHAGSGTYQVQRGDTLMKIAFETYGDLFQWRKIYEQNREHIKDPNNLEPGTSLMLEASSSNVTVERNGDKYLIKQGDTLGTISNGVYGTPKKWKKIWGNNKQLIRDPNRIFAGFYLYYSLTPAEREDADRLRQQTGAPGPLTEAAPTQPVTRAPASAAPAGLPGGGPWVQPAN